VRCPFVGDDVSASTNSPLWAWLVVGALAVPALRPRERPPTIAPGLLAELERRPSNLTTAGVRALRRLPAIGDRRAVALVRARWSHDPRTGPLLLRDVYGIGPVTVGRVASAMARRPGRADETASERSRSWETEAAELDGDSLVLRASAPRGRATDSSR
jgi:hypothetical protein